MSDRNPPEETFPGSEGFEAGIKDPFSDPTVPNGAQARWAHTNADRAFNREMGLDDPDDFSSEMPDPDTFAGILDRENNIAGLARYQPTALPRHQFLEDPKGAHVGSHAKVHSRIVTMPRIEAVDSSPEIGDQDKWNAFARSSGEVRQADLSPRRRRAASALRGLLRSNRQ